MSVKSEIIATRCADVYIDAPGIMFFDFKEEVMIDTEDLIELKNAVKQLAQGTKYPMLIRTGSGSNTTREARNYSLKDEEDLSLAEAVVIRSLPTRIAGKFYYSIYAPKHPYKIFENEGSAMNWLRTNFL